MNLLAKTAILNSLIEQEGKNILRDNHGYELSKEVIKNNEELKQYLEYGLLIEVSEEVSNKNIFDFIAYANYKEEEKVETNFQYSVFSFKASRDFLISKCEKIK